MTTSKATRCTPAFRFSVGSAALFVWVAGLAWAAPAPASHRFDIPAGAATTALKEFSEQSGEQLLFSSEALAGVKTNEVKGEMSARDALDRLLAGTGFMGRQDAQTGAYAIRKVPPDPNDARTARARAASDRPSPSRTATVSPSQPPSMKSKNPFVLLGAWLALTLGPAHTGRSADGGAESGRITGRVMNEATGQYLNNARVAVKGTDIVGFTDQSGSYQLTNVPRGPATLEVFYTGLDARELQVQIPASGSVEQDVRLTSVERYGKDPSIVKLDPFAVSTSRETDANAIAINEQRFAGNIKNVIAADAYGDVVAGNVGEFLRNVPGALWADTGETEVNEISIRGFASRMTTFSSDGAQIANAPTGGDMRTFQTKQVSLNNISRVELTKVPLPSTRADSMAGSVNMISKSAFERSQAEFRYRVSLAGNFERFSLKRTPDAYEDRNYKLYPGFEFDYTLPISRNFGLVVTGMHSRLGNPQDFTSRTFTATGAGTGASIERPYMSANQLVDAFRTSQRDSASIKADWRFAPHSVLSASIQGNSHRANPANYNTTRQTGTNGTPTPASGTPMSYGEDFTIGATGRGGVVMGSGFNHNSGATVTGNLRYVFDDGTWKVESGLSHSASRYWRRNGDHGFFSALSVGLRTPVRVTFRGIDDFGPRTTEVFDNSNSEIDLYDPANYVVTGARTTPLDTRDKIVAGNLDVRRQLDFLPFPGSLQIGGLRQQQTRDARATPESWTYNGPSGDASAAPFLARVYSNQVHYYDRSGRPMPWFSPVVAWEAWEENPSLFTQTPAQVVTAARDELRASKYLEETISALYFQAEARLLQNRLHLLTGVRYEKTADLGRGPLRDTGAVFVRNANGTFATNAAGQRIRKPEAGAAGSLEELRLLEIERGFVAKRTYDGYYPSLHLNFNATENLVARLAYARSYGRPDFSDIIPNLVSDNEAVESDPDDPSQIPGRITVTNTGLKPWTADNYDFSLEYYTRDGGIFSVGAFHKEIADFFSTSATLATAEDLEELGLDSRYLGWQISTTFNGGSARISGLEFNIRQSLRRLGGWGSYFTVFVNGTKLELKGDNEADFEAFIPESLNWGFTFTRKPFSFTARWNYIGENRGTAVASLGADVHNYYRFPRATLDVNLDYQIGRRLTLFANAKNLEELPRLQLRYGANSPAYSRQFQARSFGVIFNVGLKGTF